jgi:hypothetical protein
MNEGNVQLWISSCHVGLRWLHSTGSSVLPFVVKAPKEKTNAKQNIKKHKKTNAKQNIKKQKKKTKKITKQKAMHNLKNKSFFLGCLTAAGST